MFNILHLDFTFVDLDTGEIINKYCYQQACDDFGIVPESLVKDKTLASFCASFKRGCIKKRNISLHIDFKIQKIF